MWVSICRWLEKVETKILFSEVSFAPRKILKVLEKQIYFCPFGARIVVLPPDALFKILWVVLS